MKVFDPLTSETLIKNTNAFHEITTALHNQNNATYAGVIETQGRKKVVEHERQSRTGLYSQVAKHKRAFSSSKVNDSIDNLRGLEQTALPAKQNILAAIRNDLRTELNKKVTAIAELNKFREAHQRTEAAIYPDESKKMIGLLIFMGVIEAVLNSFFLSKGSEFGLAGGFAMAIVISLLNVLIAFFMSLCLRSAHSVTTKKNILGITFSALLAMVVVALALFIGHYRAALDDNVDSAPLKAVKSMAESPLGITTFDSWILVAITFAIFVFVTFKLFKNDDPYPGYGAISRKAKAASENYSRSKTKADKLVAILRDELTNEIDQNYETLDRLSHEFDQEEESLAQLARDYRSFLTQQALEYKSFCEECRQRFSHDCIQILDKTALFHSTAKIIEFEKLEAFLQDDDIARLKTVKHFIREFREVEFTGIRSSFLTATNKFVLVEEQT